MQATQETFKLSNNQIKTLRAAERILEKMAKSSPTTFTSSEFTRKYFQCALAGRKEEVFMISYLDTSHHLICSEIVSEGTIDCASVYPRKIIEKVIQHGCAGVLLCHNHPSGAISPSLADRRITSKLKEALERCFSSKLSPQSENYAALVSFSSDFCFSGLR